MFVYAFSTSILYHSQHTRIRDDFLTHHIISHFFFSKGGHAWHCIVYSYFPFLFPVSSPLLFLLLKTSPCERLCLDEGLETEIPAFALAGWTGRMFLSLCESIPISCFFAAILEGWDAGFMRGYEV